LEANVGGLLAEALTTHHHVVLADETVVASAHAALAGAFPVLAWVSVLDVSHWRSAREKFEKRKHAQPSMATMGA